MLQQKKLVLAILILLSVIGQFATEIYLPSMPTMAEYFGVKLNIVQFSITLYVAGFSMGALGYGSLSDTLGRRPVIIISLLIGVVGSGVCCVARSIEWLLIGRFIQGVGFSGVSVVTRSITKDICPDSITLAKLASLLGVLYAVAISFAPILGGYIEKYAVWRLNFILLFLFSLIVAGLCYWRLPETNQHQRKTSLLQMLADYAEIVANKQFLLYNLISAVTLGGIISYQTLSSYLLQIKVGLSPEVFGYTAVAVTVSIIIGGFLNSKAVARHGLNKMLRLGCCLYVIAGILYVISGLFGIINGFVILVPIILFSIGASIAFPNASSGAMSIFTTKAGAAASVYTFFQTLGAAIGSGIISWLPHSNQLSLGGLFVIVGLTGLKCNQSLQRLRKPKLTLM
ncbi:MAG: multidrug effflux MFS transporter [Burkholderiales bacterium]